MTTILPAERSPFEAIMSQVGAGLSQTLPGAMQRRGEKQQGLTAIDQLQQDIAASGGDISKMLPALARAYTLNPNLERSGMGQKFLELAAAKNSQNIPLPGEMTSGGISTGGLAPMGMPQSQQGQFFPTNIGPQQAPGNVPQPATTGKVVPLLTPDQIPAAARKLAKQYTDAGIPMNPTEAIPLVEKQEDTKRLHNETVERERQQRVEAQKDYGQKAVDYLNQAFPKDNPPSPEMQAVFQKKGEEAASRGKSEAEINRELATEAKNFRNAMVNAEKDLSAPRLQNLIERGLNGTYKNLEKAGADLRSHLKPLLDLGLYDSARKILVEKGYGPEEREAILHPLNEESKSAMNRIPELKTVRKAEKIPGVPGLGISFEKPPINPDNIKTGLLELKKADPNFSLVLARKAFEDKGYDWRAFKDVLNEMESQGFELTDDQNIQKGHLDTPPLNKLESILQGLNIIGR